MPEDGENVNDKWITVTGNGKTKNLLNPKPKLKVHNSFSIHSQPNAPTHYNRLSPTQQINNNKPSYPQAHESTAGRKKLSNSSTSTNNYGSYAKVTICSLTTASPKPRMNAQPSPRRTPTMQSMWQLILPMHNATNQLSGLPNVDKIQPTAWVLHSIKPSKNLTKQNRVYLFDATSTPSIMFTYNSGANRHYISKHDQHKAGLPILRPSTWQVGVTNRGTSNAKYVTQVPF
jgi:hypothetical protein